MDPLKRLLAVEEKRGQMVVDTILEKTSPHYNEMKITIGDVYHLSSRWNDIPNINVDSIIRNNEKTEKFLEFVIKNLKDEGLAPLIKEYGSSDYVQNLIKKVLYMESYPPSEGQTYKSYVNPQMSGNYITLVEDRQEINDKAVAVIKARDYKYLLETESEFNRQYNRAIADINVKCERLNGGCATTKEYNDKKYLLTTLYEEAKARGKAVSVTPYLDNMTTEIFKIITVGDKKRFLQDIELMIKKMIINNCSLAQRKRFRESLTKYLMNLDRITFSVQCAELDELDRKEEV
jgi:hypothetical protein